MAIETFRWTVGTKTISEELFQPETYSRCERWRFRQWSGDDSRWI